jgi:hypothetical protein
MAPINKYPQITELVKMQKKQTGRPQQDWYDPKRAFPGDNRCASQQRGIPQYRNQGDNGMAQPPLSRRPRSAVASAYPTLAVPLDGFACAAVLKLFKASRELPFSK